MIGTKDKIMIMSKVKSKILALDHDLALDRDLSQSDSCSAIFFFNFFFGCNYCFPSAVFDKLDCR